MTNRRLTDLSKKITKLSVEDLRELQKQIQSLLKEKRAAIPATVPVEIFGAKLSPAESVVKYLKENRDLTFSEIAKLINRDQRGIWGAYSRSQKKMSIRFVIKESECKIPLEVLCDRKLAILEHVVVYLKDEKEFSISEICRLLNKKTSTIWTAYQRAKKKR